MHFLWLWVGLGCTNGTQEEPSRIVEVALPVGVTDTTLKVGTVVPLSGEMEVIGRAVVDILEARASQATPVQGRRVELVAVDGAKGNLAAAQKLLEAQEIFALVAPLMSGEEQGYA